MDFLVCTVNTNFRMGIANGKWNIKAKKMGALPVSLNGAARRRDEHGEANRETTRAVGYSVATGWKPSVVIVFGWDGRSIDRRIRGRTTEGAGWLIVLIMVVHSE